MSSAEPQTAEKRPGRGSWALTLLPLNAGVQGFSTMVPLYILQPRRDRRRRRALMTTLYNFVLIPSSIFWGRMTDRLARRSVLLRRDLRRLHADLRRHVPVPGPKSADSPLWGARFRGQRELGLHEPPGHGDLGEEELDLLLLQTQPGREPRDRSSASPSGSPGRALSRSRRSSCSAQQQPAAWIVLSFLPHP